FVLFLWLLSGILLPFVAGLALAYFLDPLADRLEERGLSRLSAVGIISIITTLLALAVAIIVLPLLYQQTAAFVQEIPVIVRGARNFLLEVSNGRLARFLGESADVKKAVTDAAGGSLSWFLALLGQLGSQGLALVGVVSLVFITPVVAFYMLLDWDRMIARIDELLPRDHAETIRELAREINDVMAGFLRGQGMICLFLGVFYAVGLTVVGLRFGLVIGIITGILSFIPYLGTITGFVASVALACFQFWPDYMMIGLVIGIFILGQFIEGNFLQPKLVGNRVRLHPVWVMFALLAFGSLFGFAGALIALPVAAALGVITRFGVARYEQSKLYLGENAKVSSPPASES
ncbi:MAG: AI-2E family transporter, partial [Parvibaculum sp.]